MKYIVCVYLHPVNLSVFISLPNYVSDLKRVNCFDHPLFVQKLTRDITAPGIFSTDFNLLHFEKITPV